ncbi:cysteine hydrolase family protein [Phenylobacterium aquaticum]|uniref:cysteine hydrolase family protein n=1 Tax=Phenylobacterium aquaticum TaxID=1763816 RepID=UPI001F5CAB07|nr:cysteine hydrolase [Phenylobacterium aquaticum]MCI3132506.1 cysteine hydrolase [Phenylobacterium aquaticum]
MAHDWKIPDREYARQLTRRGRLHAFERLAAPRTALVVVDMVPFFADENPHCRDAIGPINALADALRPAGGVVAWVLPSRLDPYPELSAEFYGPQVAETFRLSGGEGPLPDRLCQGLRRQADDIFVEKTASSAFFPGRCELPQLLEARGVDTVIVVGTVTNVCCEATARDARTLGYRVIMAADANAAPTDDMHNATLRTVYRSFGDVRPTAEILQLIAQGAPPPD